MHIISRPTRREREERLAESRAKSSERNIEGVVRRTEEAYEIQRQRAREGKPFDRPYAVSGDSPEARQAEAELIARTGVSEEVVERYMAAQEKKAD
jgi:hypothetical protein